MFQFQTGAIRSKVSNNKASVDRCFNSKLVRLEDEQPGKVRLRRSMFQFQTGAIRSELAIKTTAGVEYSFQFQTGAIRSAGEAGHALVCNKRFNSKLVRLEDWIGLSGSQIQTKFQFQTGAIRSPTPVETIYSPTVFQFQTGAIRSDGNCDRC